MKGLFFFWQMMKNGYKFSESLVQCQCQKFTSMFTTIMSNMSNTISFNNSIIVIQ
jgi:hypothetical protein